MRHRVIGGDRSPTQIDRQALIIDDDYGGSSTTHYVVLGYRFTSDDDSDDQRWWPTVLSTIMDTHVASV